LSIESATHRKPGFVPSEEDDDTIGAVCRKLDRLPLAIEPAAARVNAMSPMEISASLDHRRLELGGGRRAAPTVIEEQQPTFLFNRSIPVTGGVPRTTGYESGVSTAASLARRLLAARSLVLEDQALIVDIKGKGLLVTPAAATPGSSTSVGTLAAS
jgi:hypothetical protein